VQIDLSKKIRLFFIWLVGSTAVVGGLLQQITASVTNDNFWQYTDILRWTSLDLALGVMVASLPVLDAAIVGMIVTAGTKLGVSYPSHSQSKNWTELSTKTAAKESKHHPGTITSIASDERYDGTGMAIIRTDEVHLSYHSISSTDSQGQLRYPSRLEYPKVPYKVH
jgi:hypothetical protein